MTTHYADSLEQFMPGVKQRNPGEEEFHQAVHEVAIHIVPFMVDKPRYRDMKKYRKYKPPLH